MFSIDPSPIYLDSILGPLFSCENKEKPKMEELLMCSVCIERYHESKRHPVLLPRCGHSFCRPCVAMLVSGGCIVCPTCRTDQRIDYVERLPTEYTLLAIISAQENSKKETCERHSVKLSFFCRTCETATCGECLFEDHPTHSHDVIRASKYISDMKQNAQDIAVKFIEVLDDREQNYYKIIFNCAKRISSAIMNIGVLRKDMEEARELMKGIKEDESISAATSLSEAAKFLGLKWNIQDANYQRNKAKEENAGDEIEMEKKKAQEEDAKLQMEKKEKEGGKKSSKEKTKDKSSKKLLRKSKTLSAMEMSKQVEEMKENLGNEKPEIKEKPGVENPEKEEPNSENEKQKLPETNNELKPQQDPVTDKEKDVESKPEDPKSKESEKTEENKQNEVKIEVKPKPVKQEEITIGDIIKRKEQLKRPDDNAHNDVKQQNAKNEKIPDLNSLKARAKINRIKPKKVDPPPTNPTEEKQPTESSETTPETGKEAKKDSLTPKTTEQEVKDEDKDTKDNVDGQNKDKEDERISNPDENDSSEEEDEGEDDVQKKEEKGAVAAKEDVNSGLSESSQEKKFRDPLDESSQSEGKLMDFIQVPGFMVCIEASDGRLASMEWGPQGLHVHCLQFTHVSYDLVLRDSFLNALIPSKNPTVFLELTADHTILGRVYIKLWGHLRRAHNFLSLCLGEQGKSYMNTKFLQVYNVNSPGERILGGDYEFNNGRGGRGLLDELEWNCDYAMPMKAGMITAAGSGQPATNSLFLICTQSDPTRNFSCPFGLVCEGLKVIKDAVQQTATKQIWITDCGIVLVPPKFEYKGIVNDN